MPLFNTKIGYIGTRSWVETSFHQMKDGQRHSKHQTSLPFHSVMTQQKKIGEAHLFKLLH